MSERGLVAVHSRSAFKLQPVRTLAGRQKCQCDEDYIKCYMISEFESKHHEKFCIVECCLTNLECW